MFAKTVTMFTAALLAAAVAKADVADVSPSGFQLRIAVHVAATPDKDGNMRLTIPAELLAFIDTIDAGNYRKGSLFAFYDKHGATEDSANEGTIEDGRRRPTLLSSDERGLLGRINVDGGRGYWPADFAVRQSEPGNERLAAIVVMSRPKP